MGGDQRTESIHDVNKRLEIRTGIMKLRIESLENELETERMRLAACGVVALANTEESARIARKMNKEYKSGSLMDIIGMVDQNIKLRKLLKQEPDMKDVVPDHFVVPDFLKKKETQ